MKGIGYERNEGNSGSTDLPNLTPEEIANKMDKLKKWTNSFFLVAKQYFGEKVGNRVSTSVDPELQAQINFITSSQERHRCLLRQLNELVQAYAYISSCEFTLAKTIGELLDAEGDEDIDLKASLTESKRILQNTAGNTELLCQVFNHVGKQLDTLCNQTMQDSIKTSKSLYSARLAFDSAKVEFEDQKLKLIPGSPKYVQTEQLVVENQLKYEKIHKDLFVKLKFLEANKVNVMKHQLKIMSQAIVAYYQGNGTAIQNVLNNLSPSLTQSRKPF